MGPQSTVSILVTGKVQGVFYRQSTREKALELGLTGEVQNLPDGSVQITATGTQASLEQLQTWCSQGPPKAVVHSVTVNKLPLQSFHSFTILRH